MWGCERVRVGEWGCEWYFFNSRKYPHYQVWTAHSRQRSPVISDASAYLSAYTLLFEYISLTYRGKGDPKSVFGFLMFRSVSEYKASQRKNDKSLVTFQRPSSLCQKLKCRLHLKKSEINIEYKYMFKSYFHWRSSPHARFSEKFEDILRSACYVQNHCCTFF